jgi:methionine-R-sulfoxide reductase
MLTWKNVLHFASKGNPVPPYRLEKTDAEWKKLLTEEEFYITRKKGTERAFTGAYCEAHDPGLYACRCCGTLLFDATVKFESGTGWPSFTQPVSENAIAYHQDTTFGMMRVEVTCNVCDGHLGHVFPDGPAPSGLRYCINSASIKLVDSLRNP